MERSPWTYKIVPYHLANILWLLFNISCGEGETDVEIYNTRMRPPPKKKKNWQKTDNSTFIHRFPDPTVVAFFFIFAETSTWNIKRKLRLHAVCYHVTGWQANGGAADSADWFRRNNSRGFPLHKAKCGTCLLTGDSIYVTRIRSGGGGHCWYFR